KGRVLNHSQKPIKSAIVYLSNQKINDKTLTDDNGNYYFEGLQNGVYPLRFTSPFSYTASYQIYIKNDGLQFDIHLNESISQADLDSSLFSIVYTYKGGEEIEIELPTVNKSIQSSLKLPSDTVAIWIKNGQFLTMPFKNWPIKFEKERNTFYSEIISKKDSTIFLHFDLESLPKHWEVNTHFVKSVDKENELINQTIIYMSELESHSLRRSSYNIHKASLVYANSESALQDFYSILKNNIRMEKNLIKKEIYLYGYIFRQGGMGEATFTDSLYLLVNPASPYLGLYHDNYINFDYMWNGDIDKQIAFTKKFIQVNPIDDAKSALLTYTLRKMRNKNQFKTADYSFFRKELATKYPSIGYTKRYLEEEAAWIELMKPK
ncbi:carboxypeptidase-like regulatory domain-containing protein, partial [Limnoraphis robusta]